MSPKADTASVDLLLPNMPLFFFFSTAAVIVDDGGEEEETIGVDVVVAVALPQSLGVLGSLPPLLLIAEDAELLRDDDLGSGSTVAVVVVVVKVSFFSPHQSCEFASFLEGTFSRCRWNSLRLCKAP